MPAAESLGGQQPASQGVLPQPLPHAPSSSALVHWPPCPAPAPPLLLQGQFRSHPTPCQVGLVAPVPMCPPPSVHGLAKAVTRQPYNGAICFFFMFLESPLLAQQIVIILTNTNMKYQFLIIKHNEIIKIKSHLYFALKFYILCCTCIWL